MTTIRVTVDLTVTGLPDEDAREHARAVVEGRGLPVSGVSIRRAAGEGKTFVPKAGKPGSVLVRDGRSFQVWAEGPNKGTLWLVPTERQDDDAPVYLGTSWGAQPHTALGKPIREQVSA